VWRKIFDNLGIKIVALVLALFLWFNTTINKNYDYELKLPLRIENLPINSIVANILPPDVLVKVSGKGKQILKLLLSRQREVVIDVRNFELKETNHILKPEEVRLPETQELRVDEIVSPKFVMISLDNKVEERMPVVSQIEIIPKDGYVQVGEVMLEPKEITVLGPKRILKNLKTIATQKIEIKDIDKSINQEVELELPKEVNLHLSAQKVTFQAEIQKGIEKKFTGVKLAPLNLSPNRKAFFEPDNGTVMILGTENSLVRIEPESLRLWVDCKNLKKRETLFLKASLELPLDTRLIEIIPDSFKVTLR
jgi:YbbR domain-containing protein